MSWLLSPLSWLFVAALLSPLAWLARSRWLAAGCLMIGAAAFLASTPWIANRLLKRLERPVAIEDPQHCSRVPPDTVVVLAGGVDQLPRSMADFNVMNIQSRRRTERGVQYWREGSGRQVILTGGQLRYRSYSNADLMGEYAQWLGVPRESLRLERRSANTRENASNVAGMEPRVPPRISLVTSAMHMPRALMEFQAVGFDVCPLPADFRSVSTRLPDSLVPTSNSLMKTEAALHEMLGNAFYRWQRWRSGDGHRVTQD